MEVQEISLIDSEFNKYYRKKFKLDRPSPGLHLKLLEKGHDVESCDFCGEKNSGIVFEWPGGVHFGLSIFHTERERHFGMLAWVCTNCGKTELFVEDTLKKYAGLVDEETEQNVENNAS